MIFYTYTYAYKDVYLLLFFPTTTITGLACPFLGVGEEIDRVREINRDVIVVNSDVINYIIR